MKLRELRTEDAPLMLEWMHDESVVKDLQANFAEKTIDDCRSFIEGARQKNENIHLAIADDKDEYMGTVSLKHIYKDTAEFGISVRTAAMGKGFSIFALNEICRMGKEELNITKVYWCVNKKNARALRFYDKNNYPRICITESSLAGVIRSLKTYTEEQLSNYVWYCLNL